MDQKLNNEECSRHLLPVRDALELLSGKWKLPIILYLGREPKRFRELQREIEGITAKMLSKELKDLEMNLLVKREVFHTMPVTIEYSLTEYGDSLKPLIIALYEWGSNHRERIKQHHREAVPA